MITFNQTTTCICSSLFASQQSIESLIEQFCTTSVTNNSRDIEKCKREFFTLKYSHSTLRLTIYNCRLQISTRNGINKFLSRSQLKEINLTFICLKLNGQKIFTFSFNAQTHCTKNL